ncbi:ABC transporter permease [Streptomyces sp. NPDC005840]|uniref:ABC transporter permease n=1 Tax=Streptomyces sp. NPDC005840 TaxID=3157072 RepID=UPI0033C642C1
MNTSLPAARLRTFLSRRTEIRAVVFLVLVLVYAAVWQPDVLQRYDVTLARIALDGLVALGLTLVILQGELDLSVGSVLAASGAVLALTPGLALGIVLALALGVAVGALNAVLVVVLKVNSFIATLGTMFAVRGLAFVLTDGQPVPIKDIESGIAFGQALLGPLTPRVLFFVVVFLALHVFLTRTRAGREFYAVGGNRQAAIDAGLPVRRRLATSFVMCAVLASCAGIINTLELTSADPTAGSTVMLVSIASAVVGGVLLNGGRGTIVGALIGAAALGILQISLDFGGYNPEIKNILVGAVLFVAVATDPSSLRIVRDRLKELLGRLLGRAAPQRQN